MKLFDERESGIKPGIWDWFSLIICLPISQASCPAPWLPRQLPRPQIPSPGPEEPTILQISVLPVPNTPDSTNQLINSPLWVEVGVVEQGEHSRVLQDQCWEAVASGNNWHYVHLSKYFWNCVMFLCTLYPDPTKSCCLLLTTNHPRCPHLIPQVPTVQDLTVHSARMQVNINVVKYIRTLV